VPAWLSGSKPMGAAPSPPLTAHKEGQPSPSQLIKRVDSSRKAAEAAMVAKDAIMRSGRLDTLYMTLLHGSQQALCTHVRCSFAGNHWHALHIDINTKTFGKNLHRIYNLPRGTCHLARWQRICFAMTLSL